MFEIDFIRLKGFKIKKIRLKIICKNYIIE